ncbi:LysR family transcriptional regulator [Burkholderia plantarii]|uniref:LysR family transcriptional regulator n=1 Tax=Burkholderia plantarii TaxID=41899 RepID=UPI0018DCBB2D|nr:LysR family transcriptional regulator [Burkholderia plantarii]MBI0329461.1 LysR family transcriptional regulator [Burkholderia plantarii]
MNLEDLEYFLAVADAGRMHRAAAQVGTSQPALTKAIRRLETQLHVPLFDRSPKGMQLTQFGVAFQQHALNMRTEYRQSLKQIEELHAGELAKVMVGAAPAAEPLVGRAFLSLMKKRPAMRMGLKVQLSDGLLRSLIDGDIDIAVSPLSDQVPDEIRSRILFDELTTIVCRKGHPILSAGASVTPDEIATCTWILPGPGVSVRQRIDAYLRKHGLNGPIVQVESTYGSPIGVFTLIANSQMLGVCSAQHRALAEHFGLQVIQASGLRWTRKIACLTRKAGSLSPLAQTFVEHIDVEAKALRNDVEARMPQRV